MGDFTIHFNEVAAAISVMKEVAAWGREQGYRVWRGSERKNDLTRYEGLGKYTGFPSPFRFVTLEGLKNAHRSKEMENCLYYLMESIILKMTKPCAEVQGWQEQSGSEFRIMRKL